jgi:hypothetical protein
MSKILGIFSTLSQFFLGFLTETNTRMLLKWRTNSYAHSQPYHSQTILNTTILS